MALKRVMDDEGMELEITINPETNDNGNSRLLPEQHFKNAHRVDVPCQHFLPVKSCSDLLSIKTNIYSLQHGQLIINPQRMFETTPVIKLGDHFVRLTFLVMGVLTDCVRLPSIFRGSAILEEVQDFSSLIIFDGDWRRLL